jgi:hypothetical protein
MINSAVYLETKDKIKEYGFTWYSVFLEPVKSTKWGMLVYSFMVFLSSYGSECHIFYVACDPVQVQKLPQQSMVEFVFFHHFYGVRFISVN